MGTITISLADLEAMIRRVMREEFDRCLPSTVDDWSQAGPDDPGGDEELLADALIVLEQYGDKPEIWAKWKDFETKALKAAAHRSQSQASEQVTYSVALPAIGGGSGRRHRRRSRLRLRL